MGLAAISDPIALDVDLAARSCYKSVIINMCFLLEIKIKTCTDSFIFHVWNNSNVNWACNEAEGSRGGMIALWDDTKFQVSSV